MIILLCRIFSFILSNDENYLMAVIFKGFKIFSFRSYLWKTCLLPGSVRNIMSGTKRLTYTAAFSHDNRYVSMGNLSLNKFFFSIQLLYRLC